MRLAVLAGNEDVLAYDDAPRPLKRPADALTRTADTAGRDLQWPALKGTGKEMNSVLRLAEGLKPPPETLPLPSREAGTAQLLEALPRARWAHLATHGFFAAPGSEERKKLLDERLFTSAFGGSGSASGHATR